ncbi:MAG: M48 family peptidase, partial [Proteobacteria bacterium]|nr:M48 family peptidase [Pseudomonadota bacterium]
MHNTVFYIFIGIILFDFVLERTINYLNSRNWSDELPEEVRDVYDAEKYRKSQEYKKANDKFSILTSSFNLVLILLMLFLGGFAFFDSISQSLVQNSIAIPLVFFAILMFCADIINTPFAVYDTFVIEEKFGFNKTTPKTFILDKLKGWMLSAILGGGILALFVLFYQATGKL